jgi:hypothetical protein
LRNHVDRMMEREPGAAALYYGVLSRLKAGEWPDEFVDAVFQKADPTANVYDAYVIAQVFGRTLLGEIGVAFIPIDRGPPRDSEGDAINEILGTLSRPYRARFWGGKRDADGSLGWDEPISFQTGPDWGDTVTVPPGGVPLEVGTMAASKTIALLMPWDDRAGVARWPYGANLITIFRVLKATARRTTTTG